jgi:hypothetical protein
VQRLQGELRRPGAWEKWPDMRGHRTGQASGVRRLDNVTWEVRRVSSLGNMFSSLHHQNPSSRYNLESPSTILLFPVCVCMLGGLPGGPCLLGSCQVLPELECPPWV